MHTLYFFLTVTNLHIFLTYRTLRNNGMSIVKQIKKKWNKRPEGATLVFNPRHNTTSLTSREKQLETSHCLTRASLISTLHCFLLSSFICYINNRIRRAKNQLQNTLLWRDASFIDGLRSLGPNRFDCRWISSEYPRDFVLTLWWQF